MGIDRPCVSARIGNGNANSLISRALVMQVLRGLSVQMREVRRAGLRRIGLAVPTIAGNALSGRGMKERQNGHDYRC